MLLIIKIMMRVKLGDAVGYDDCCGDDDHLRGGGDDKCYDDLGTGCC